MAERRSYYSGNKLDPVDVARYLYQAGFRGDDLIKMLAIGGRESGYDPGAHGTSADPSLNMGDRGLFQINYVHDPSLKSAGIIDSAADLYDPLTNAKAAYWLFDRRGDFGDWSAGSGGFTDSGDPLYGTDIDAARAAFQQARQQGWAVGGGGGGGGGLNAIARGLANLGIRDYREYATDPWRVRNARANAINRILGANGGIPAPADPVFFNWQEHPDLNNQYNRLSPHIQALERIVLNRLGGESAGDYVERNVTGGSSPSTHAFGAAWDWQPENRADADKMIALITANPGAFGIQAIHDYANNRVWRIGREGDLGGGWQSQAPGSHGGSMGSANHLHFETTPDAFDTPGRRAMRLAFMGRYADGTPATPEERAAVARRLGNRGNELFEPYATISGPQLERRQERYAARHEGEPGAGNADPQEAADRREMTSLLAGLGVRYPNAPRPTSSLMAYLRGVGLTLSSAEDVRRKMIGRARLAAGDARTDIRRANLRAREGITADLVRRGVLGSGEANTRYARQAEDVAASIADVKRAKTEGIENAWLGYNDTADQVRQAALERVIDTERQQEIDEGTSAAQTRWLRRQRRATRRGNRNYLDAVDRTTQRQIDLLNRGVGV